MDKIWHRNPSKSEVIDRCGGDEKKTNDHAAKKDKNDWDQKTQYNSFQHLR